MRVDPKTVFSDVFCQCSFMFKLRVLNHSWFFYCCIYQPARNISHIWKFKVKCKRTGLMASHRTFTVSTALIEHYLRRKLIFLVLPWSLETQMCSLHSLIFFKSIINRQLFITWIFANYGLLINNFNNWYLSLKKLGIHTLWKMHELRYGLGFVLCSERAACSGLRPGHFDFSSLSLCCPMMCC